MAQEGFEEMEGNPGLEVFLKCRIKAQLRGPLDVVALVRGVDARFVDYQGIELLNRFQLEVPSPRKPRGDYVLRQLRMRTRRRADRVGGGRGKDPCSLRGARLPEMFRGDVEYRSFSPELGKASPKETPEGDRAHPVTHERPSYPETPNLSGRLCAQADRLCRVSCAPLCTAAWGIEHDTPSHLRVSVRRTV